MAVFVLNDAQFYFDGFDLTGDMNRVELNLTAEDLDKTVFGNNGWRARTSGLLVSSLSASGFLSMGDGDVDDVLFDNLAGANTVITVAATGDDGDNSAYTFKALHSRYQHRGTVGELAAWEMDGMGRDTQGVVKGTFLHDNSTARTVSGNGTARQVGAAVSGEKVYASLHVLAASGTSPTLDVIVQSDDNSGMTTPTNRITFTQATAAGAEWGTPVDGPVTDTWWRVDYTIGGTSPSFTFVVIVGVK